MQDDHAKWVSEIGPSNAEECTCGHPNYWHSRDLTRCEFHCGNPEVCPCPGFRAKRTPA
jgi:hypothetical protein